MGTDCVHSAAFSVNDVIQRHDDFDDDVQHDVDDDARGGARRWCARDAFEETNSGRLASGGSRGVERR